MACTGTIVTVVAVVSFIQHSCHHVQAQFCYLSPQYMRNVLFKISACMVPKEIMIEATYSSVMVKGAGAMQEVLDHEWCSLGRFLDFYSYLMHAS